MSNTKFSPKDDQDFNIWFIKKIEKYPCVYDHNDPNYTNRIKQDEVWQTMAKEAGASIADCKERWKNLRACYTRHLKNKLVEMKTGIKYRRPYYLAEYMNFILPHTKLRSSPYENLRYFDDAVKDLDSIDNVIFEAENEEEDQTEAEDVKLLNFSSPTPSNQSITTDPHPKLNNFSAEEMTLLKYGTESSKRKRITDEDDSDFNFLKSLLPDMKSMNNSQKRKFKIKVLKICDEILDQ